MVTTKKKKRKKEKKSKMDTSTINEEDSRC